MITEVIEYSYNTVNGSRPYNEDTVVAEIVDDIACFVVCDGLGGHGKGEVASQFVAGTIIDIFLEEPANPSFVTDSINEAQSRLMELQRQEGLVEKMKTTVSLLRIQKNKFEIAYIGDTRIYHFNKRKLIKRTLDHSVPQRLVEARLIKEKDISHHPDRNKLLKVCGVPWSVPQYELDEGIIKKDYDVFLLCTDGFWEWIEEKTMIKYLRKSKSPQEWIDLMFNEVLTNGDGHNMDNITALGVFVYYD